MKKAMSAEAYEKYQAFMIDRRRFAESRTPEEKTAFYEQVKGRVITLVDALGYTDLSRMLSNRFWQTHLVYDEIEARKQARSMGCPENKLNDDEPYSWYMALKPFARKLAIASRGYAAHFARNQ